MKVGNLVEWVLNQPGFPKRRGVITHTFYRPGNPNEVASHRVHWFNARGESFSNSFRPSELTVLS